MATETLDGMKVAILVTDGFEQVEMTEPRSKPQEIPSFNLEAIRLFASERGESRQATVE